jgi:hypothetical protein
MFATWLYVSTSLLGQNAEAEIISIRKIAELRNPELGLTGVLIFSGRRFAQFLEGPDSGLEAIKKSIWRDDGHADVLTLQTNPIEKRRSAIDSVLSHAARAHSTGELVNYMDEFVSKLR